MTLNIYIMVLSKYSSTLKVEVTGRYISTRLHGVISNKTEICIFKFSRNDHAENLLLTEDVGLNPINAFYMN
jgi:hypothetical protein